MKISVAGEDVTKDVANTLNEVAATRRDESSRSESSVLELTTAASEKEYSHKHIEQLRSRCYVDNTVMKLPDSSACRSVRNIMWKIMRPVFDWVTHKQNNINAQIVHAMEMEKRERDREILQLRQEIEELKKKT